jgi:hypothetical protein
MIEPGQYETVDGLMAVVNYWDKESSLAIGIVLDYPTKGRAYNTTWASNGKESDDKDELDLDLDID